MTPSSISAFPQSWLITTLCPGRQAAAGTARQGWTLTGPPPTPHVFPTPLHKILASRFGKFVCGYSPVLTARGVLTTVCQMPPLVGEDLELYLLSVLAWSCYDRQASSLMLASERPPNVRSPHVTTPTCWSFRQQPLCSIQVNRHPGLVASSKSKDILVERKSAMSFYRRHGNIEARGKHDDSSRTSVVVVLVYPGRDPKPLVVATRFGTVAPGMLAELLNDLAVNDVPMSMYNVSDPRRC